MAERYAFTAEWYDDLAALTKIYNLLYYPEESTSSGVVEMVDVKNRRMFLKKTRIDGLKLEDLYIGSTVTIHSRQLHVVDYADEFTRKSLGRSKEKSLVMVKPHAMSKMGEIMDRAISEGFTLCNAEIRLLSREEVVEFYAEHREKEFFDRLLIMMTEGPVLAFEINGPNAVLRWREILGPTDPTEARKAYPNTIRAQFGTSETRNACHSSDSVESAKRELEFFFGTKVAKGKGTAKFKDTTFGLIKPHAVASGHVGKILSEIVSPGRGLAITALKLRHMEKVNAQEFLEVYKGVVREYPNLVEELISGPCVALEIAGDDAHSEFRKLTGPPDPEIARHLRPNTLRAKFGVDKVKNAVHCTDLPEDAPLEVEYFFKILS